MTAERQHATDAAREPSPRLRSDRFVQRGRHFALDPGLLSVTLVIAAQEQEAELTGLAGWVADVIAALGAFGVGVLVALENLFPPLPSEVILPLAGFLAGQGRMSLLSVIVWATVGSVAGALILYTLGAAFGRTRLRRLVDRVPLMSTEDVDRAEVWFERYGEQAVLFGRMIPIVRSLISVPAGVERMPLARFAVYTTVGSGVWNTIFIGLGYLLGEQWEDVGRYSDWLNYGVVVAAVAAVAVFVVRRVRRLRRT